MILFDLLLALSETNFGFPPYFSFLLPHVFSRPSLWSNWIWLANLNSEKYNEIPSMYCNSEFREIVFIIREFFFSLAWLIFFFVCCWDLNWTVGSPLFAAIDSPCSSTFSHSFLVCLCRHISFFFVFDFPYFRVSFPKNNYNPDPCHSSFHHYTCRVLN